MIMTERVSKEERLLNLICTLIKFRSLTFAEIRQKVHGYHICKSEEAARRMFERDKDELEKAGIRLNLESNKYYSIDYRFAFDKKLNLLQEEKKKLAEILAELKNFKGTFDTSTLNSAIKKIAVAHGIFPEVYGGNYGKEVPFGFQILLDEREKEFAQKIEKAIDSRRKLYLKYTPILEQRTKEYVLEPFRLVLWEGEWYLAGLTQNGPKLFKLKRIVELRVLDELVETSEEELKEKAVEALKIQADQNLEVEIKCPSGFAEAIERKFDAERCGEEQDKVYLRIKANRPEFFLLSFAPYLPVLDIIRPYELKEFIIEKISAIFGGEKNAQ